MNAANYALLQLIRKIMECKNIFNLLRFWLSRLNKIKIKDPILLLSFWIECTFIKLQELWEWLNRRKVKSNINFKFNSQILLKESKIISLDVSLKLIKKNTQYCMNSFQWEPISICGIDHCLFKLWYTRKNKGFWGFGVR